MKSEQVNPRKHGAPPYPVAVLHGGPGAAGSARPLARELGLYCGTLEPLQTASTIDGQVRELESLLKPHADCPLTLIGHSWGAWLGLIFTANYPECVGKLILVGSGPIEEHDAAGIMETRLARLSEVERRETTELMEILNSPDSPDSTTNETKDAALARFGALMGKTDAFDPIPHHAGVEDDEVEIRGDIMQSVWAEAAALRRSGELLKIAGHVQCPVLAIHGAYDPHPAEGVARPLSRIIKNFRFILLEACGHEPWSERQARDRFFEILGREIPNVE